MKRILLFLSALFIATTAIAHTINWYVDDSVYYTTTCESGENVTPPTAPEKYGYTFRGWQDVTPVEYIESTGTQYIDTGIQQSDYAQNLIVTATLQFTTLNDIQYSMGTTITSVMYFMPLVARNSLFDSNIGAPASDIKTQASDTNIHTIICDSVNGSLQIDNNLYIYASNNAMINYNIYLFAINEAGKPIRQSYIRFYNISFSTKEGTLIRDFIPVLDKDGTPCMYDKVERKFYYNAGTGDFIAGPIVGE